MSQYEIWKVLRSAEVAQLLSAGEFTGSPDDLADGFIHLSTSQQLVKTLEKHFMAEKALCALLCYPRKLEGALRWETSRGGALFPHLYRSLHRDDIFAITPIPDERTKWTPPAFGDVLRQ
ncbi:MAG: DUF952 domain-containing protein [Pseudomonadota bacterium]